MCAKITVVRIRLVSGLLYLKDPERVKCYCGLKLLAFQVHLSNMNTKQLNRPQRSHSMFSFQRSCLRY